MSAPELQTLAQRFGPSLTRSPSTFSQRFFDCYTLFRTNTLKERFAWQREGRRPGRSLEDRTSCAEISSRVRAIWKVAPSNPLDGEGEFRWVFLLAPNRVTLEKLHKMQFSLDLWETTWMRLAAKKLFASFNDFLCMNDLQSIAIWNYVLEIVFKMLNWMLRCCTGFVQGKVWFLRFSSSGINFNLFASVFCCKSGFISRFQYRNAGMENIIFFTK